MTTPTLLDRLHRRGVRFRIDGDRLRWRAPTGVMAEDDISDLREQKAEALAIIRDEQRDQIEERAAIMEFDGEMTREEAERRARAEIEQRRPKAPWRQVCHVAVSRHSTPSVGLAPVSGPESGSR